MIIKQILLLTGFCSFFAFAAQAQKEFTLRATLPDSSYNGKSAVFFGQTTKIGEEAPILDSTIVEAGTYTLSTPVKEKPYVLFVTVVSANSKDVPIMPVVVEEGTAELIYKPLSIRGTANNNLFNEKVLVAADETSKQAKDIGDQMQAALLEGGLSTEKKAEYKQAFDELQNKLVNSYFSFIEANLGNEVADFFYLQWHTLFTFDQKKELFPYLSEATQTKVQKQEEAIKKDEELLKRAEQSTAIGQPYKDITLPTPDGTNASLSDYVGKHKVILLDFWASWCGPCIQEMPFVRGAYERYKEKGFEIVGISLDKSKENWTAAIERLKMTWPQLSDLGGWQSAAAQLYKVKSIPRTLLLDENGVIIAKDLRGAALEKKLAEVLGEE